VEKYTSIIVGTGFSGIAMGIKLKEKGIHDFIILEKARDVGGTWRENTYPGAECDIPSALYSFSFEQYPDWEYKWSMQPQILEYIKHVVNKYGLLEHIRFQKELVSARWSEQESHWQVATKDGGTYQSKTLVIAIGQLHHPSVPDFVGKEKFKKPSFHSAQWDHSVDLNGKTVGVIGNAASAVQFIPEIAKSAEKLVVFQRSANWILPKQDRLYKAWEKKLLRKFPSIMSLYRFRLWLMGGALFYVMKQGNNSLRKLLEKRSIRYIKRHIKDPKLQQQLIPKFPLGAKRVLFSDTYYPALSREHVNVIVGEIKSIKKQGVQTKDERIFELDVLIYATGFKSNPFLLGLDIRGRDELSIREAWKDGTQNYLGITISNFPNFFMMYGPNTNLGHNSIVIMSEAQASYISLCISELVKSKRNTMEVKPSVMDSYYQDIQARLQKMIWASIDKSWYKDANGDLANNYPGRTLEYIRKTKHVNFEEFYFS